MVLKEGQYWGHEVYFPDGNPPDDIIDKLIAQGFEQFEDNFFIHREDLALFIETAKPYRVSILQANCLCGGVITTEDWNEMLDLINALKKAGVQGIDNFCEKLKRC